MNLITFIINVIKVYDVNFSDMRSLVPIRRATVSTEKAIFFYIEFELIRLMRRHTFYRYIFNYIIVF